MSPVSGENPVSSQSAVPGDKHESGLPQGEKSRCGPGAQDDASARLDDSAAQVHALRANLESGELRLDPSAGGNLTAVLLEQRDRVDAWLKRVEALAGLAPLGRNPVGDAMAAKFAKRASGGDVSFAEVLRKYRHVLDEAREAVDDAMRRYRDVEDGAADEFRKLAR